MPAFQAIGIFGPFTWIRPDGSSPGGLEKLETLNFHAAAFMMAPSMTTPAVTYFQSATSSLRARATMVAFFSRPPLYFHPLLEPAGKRRIRLVP
jgi:hypothetical protein